METTKKTKEMDMLNGGLAGKLILFSIPLAFSSILQQLFNSADVAVVGRFAGEQALAAVVASVAGAAVVAASVAAAVVDAAVVSLCVPFVSDPPVDAAVVDVPEEPAAVVAAAELSGATLSPGTYPSGIPSTAAADVDSTAVVSSGETFTVPVFLRITAACPL